MKKIGGVIFDFFYYFLLALFLIMLVCFLIGIKPYFVPTGSMEPNLHAKSLVFVNERFDYTELEIGDIIVYEREYDDLLIIHRIIEITDDGVYTKGDANPVADGICITPNIFIGKCIYVIPKLGAIFEPIHELRMMIADSLSHIF